MANSEPLTDRQRREIEFHRQHAQKNRNRAELPVSLEVISSKARRWWNAYWSTYDILRNMDLAGKRVLVPGSGFGEDAIRIAHLGAEVFGFDISPESVAISNERAQKFSSVPVRFDTMGSEAMSYEDDFFDLVLFLDILHHVDIPKTLGEVVRVLKPGGRIVGSELYTHSIIERLVRRNVLVDKIIYPKMVKYIYNNENPYITEDEHKIDEKEFNLIKQIMTNYELKYFNIFVGRLVPDRFAFASKIDRAFARCLGSAGRFLAGRVVFNGTVG